MTAASGVSAGLLGNPDPNPSEEEECKNKETPEICIDAWCYSVTVGCLTFIRPPANFEPIPQEDIDRLLGCLNDTYGTLETCMGKVCKDRYVETQEYPIYSQCADQWAIDKANCDNAQSFCGISYAEDLHPDLHAVLRAACREAATRKYNACNNAAEPYLGSGNRNSGGTQSGSGEELLNGLHGNDEFSNRVLIPANGRNTASATWTPLPGIGESVASMQMIWVLPDYEQTLILYSDPIVSDQDGIYSLEIGEASIDRFVGIDHISVLILWKDLNDTVIWGESMEFRIEATDILGDFDRNGAKGHEDLASYLYAYDLKAPRADMNYDLVIDESDLALFLAEYDTE